MPVIPLFSESTVQDATVVTDPTTVRRAKCSNPFYDGLTAYQDQASSQTTPAVPDKQSPELTFQTPEYV